jgi:PAS domain S-box-containing protein
VTQAVKVLMLEDSEDDAKLALRALRHGGFEPTHRRIQTAAELKSALVHERWDAVISDFMMPGFTGIEALGIVRAADLDIPFILVSGTIGEETAVSAMKAGAGDYVMKNNLARLAPALERELKEAAIRAENRRAQRDLVESEQRLRTIIETEPECVKVVSQKGVLLEMNAAGLAMLEADSLAAAQSRTLLDFVVPECRAAFNALMERVIGGDNGILEFEVIGLKGGRRWLETHAAPFGGINGKEAMLLGITRDITERKRAEEIRAKSLQLEAQNLHIQEASRMKSEFMASMSHELRTPLNAIIGFTGVLLMKLPGPLNADQEKQLRTVQTGARHLLALINDLLDLSRIESGKVEQNLVITDCTEVIEEVAASLRPQAEAKGLEFTVTVPKGLTMLTDRRALSQIIINLVNNAIKFTERGSVRFTAERREESGSRTLEVSVEDTGSGIRSEDQGKLFQAFTQVGATKGEEGTGLGLHVSQKIAQTLGGRIELKSEYGRGSTFTLMLPEA